MHNPFDNPNTWIEAGATGGWDDPEARRGVELLSVCPVSDDERALAATAPPDIYRLIWAGLAEDVQSSFDPSDWPTEKELLARLRAMSKADIDAAADELAGPLAGICRRYGTLNTAAHIAMHARDFEKVLALTHVGERIMPMYFGVYQMRANALYGLGRREEAEPLWARAIEVAPPSLRRQLPAGFEYLRKQIDASAPSADAAKTQ